MANNIQESKNEESLSISQLMAEINFHLDQLEKYLKMSRKLGLIIRINTDYGDRILIKKEEILINRLFSS